MEKSNEAFGGSLHFLTHFHLFLPPLQPNSRRHAPSPRQIAKLFRLLCARTDRRKEGEAHNMRDVATLLLVSLHRTHRGWGGLGGGETTGRGVA